jgi:hypothetical protein
MRFEKTQGESSQKEPQLSRLASSAMAPIHWNRGPLWGKMTHIQV